MIVLAITLLLCTRVIFVALSVDTLYGRLFAAQCDPLWCVGFHAALGDAYFLLQQETLLDDKDFFQHRDDQCILLGAYRDRSFNNPVDGDTLDIDLVTHERRVDDLLALVHNLANAYAARLHWAGVHVKNFLDHGPHQGRGAHLAARVTPLEWGGVQGQMIAAVLLPDQRFTRHEYRCPVFELD
jgi:hypothetical protein